MQAPAGSQREAEDHPRPNKQNDDNEAESIHSNTELKNHIEQNRDKDKEDDNGNDADN